MTRFCKLNDLDVWKSARGAKKLTMNFTFNSKMPTIYHDNCGKPGPKSNDYIPPQDARLFKSRSAPNSPMLVRQTLFPPRTPRPLDRSPTSPRLTRAATLFVEKRKIEKTEKTESKSKEIKSEQKWKIGRSRSFNNKCKCVSLY